MKRSLCKSLPNIKEIKLEKFPDNLTKEDDNGNIEYKLKLININQDKKVNLASQMKFRLSEGNGSAFYIIGVNNNGKQIGLNKEEFIETWLNLVQVTREINVNIMLEALKKSDNKYLAKFFIIQDTKNLIINSF